MKKNSVYKNEDLSHTSQCPHLVAQMFLVHFGILGGLNNRKTRAQIPQLALHWIVITLPVNSDINLTLHNSGANQQHPAHGLKPIFLLLHARVHRHSHNLRETQ